MLDCRRRISTAVGRPRFPRAADAKPAKTKEIDQDALLADFDSRGRLMGLEVLAPVKLSALLKQVKAPARKPFKRFLQFTAPREFVVM